MRLLTELFYTIEALFWRTAYAFYGWYNRTKHHIFIRSCPVCVAAHSLNAELDDTGIP